MRKVIIEVKAWWYEVRSFTFVRLKHGRGDLTCTLCCELASAGIPRSARFLYNIKYDCGEGL